MLFTTWDYILPTVGIFILANVVFWVIFVLFRIRKPRGNKKILIIPWLSFLMIIIAGIYAYSSMPYWAHVLDKNARSDTVGIVEGIRPAGRTPIYYDRLAGSFSTPSFITISGVDYYILTDTGISLGQTISVTYCTEGRAVLEWSATGGGKKADGLISSGPSSYTSAELPAENIPFITAPEMIVLYAFILVGMLIFNRPISQKRMSYLHTHDVAVKGLVSPRKPSAATCPLEFMVSIFAAMSFLTGSAALKIVLIALSICLWCVQFCIQHTTVIYEDEQFTYLTIGVCKTYRISDVREVNFVPTRHEGCMQLQIHLAGNQTILLEELHFAGLEYLFSWLTTKGGKK